MQQRCRSAERSRGAGIRCWLLAALTALGCQVERGEAPYCNLAESLELARLASETRSLDLGSPEARPHLISGWSEDRLDPRRDQRFVASLGPRSELRLELAAPRSLSLTLTVRLPGVGEVSQLEIGIGVNGRRIGTISLADRQLATHRIEVPAAATRAGANLLVFEYRVPAGHGGESPRLFWYRLELDGEAGPPRVLADGGERSRLWLPAGSEVEYRLFVEPGSVWKAESLSLRGGGATFELELETDGGGVRRVASFSTPASRPEAPLGEDRRVAARLVLRSRQTPSGAGGVLLDSPALWAPLEAAEPGRPEAVSAPADRPHVVLYLVDTLRRDRIGSYGYARPVTPNLDAFAGGATVFVNAIAQSSWTKPSMGSIFVGVWPPAHGAVGWKSKLPPEAVTLAELLRGAGYRTAGFVTNPFVERELGFGQGFEDYVLNDSLPSDEVNDLVFAWLDRHGAEAPFFLYVHTMDPHQPYEAPERFQARFAPDPVRAPGPPWPPEEASRLSDHYDAEVAFTDESFGALIASLESRRLLRRSLVIVTSDHGEEFMEHGDWQHGFNMHAETLNVPLIVKFPGQVRGRRVERPVQHTDLLPTVLGLVGLPVPPAADGRRLDRPLAAAGPAGAGRAVPVYSHLELGKRGYHRSIVVDQWKLILTEGAAGGDRARLYDWTQDPGETRDLSRRHPILVSVLELLLEHKTAATSGRPPAEEAILTPEQEKILRALGYLQ